MLFQEAAVTFCSTRHEGHHIPERTLTVAQVRQGVRAKVASLPLDYFRDFTQGSEFLLGVSSTP